MSNNSSNSTSGSSKIITTIIAVIFVIVSAFLGGEKLFTAESRESLGISGLENVSIQTRKILY